MIALLDWARPQVGRSRPVFAAAAALLATLSLTPSAGIAQGPGNPNSVVGRVEALEQRVLAQGQEIELLKEQLRAPVEVHVDAVARGSYKSDGTTLPAGGGYIVGDIRGEAPSFAAELRNFFVFDLTQAREATGASLIETQPVTIEEAELVIANPAGGFVSTSSDIETYKVNRAGLDFSGTKPPSVFELMAGSAGKAGFTDLADGPGYGSYVASDRASNPDSVTIRLTRAALHDLNQRINDSTDGGASPIRDESRLFAIGGNISTLNEAPDLEHLFARTADSPVTLILKLRVSPP